MLNSSTPQNEADHNSACPENMLPGLTDPEKTLHRQALCVLRLLQEEAMLSFPAFPGAFGQLRLIADTALSSPLETDGCSLFYHPVRICSSFLSSAGQLRYAYLHIHLHCLLLHTAVRSSAAVRDRRLWNMACDLSAAWIAGMLTKEYSRLSSGCFHTPVSSSAFDRFHLSRERWMHAPLLLPVLARSDELRQLAASCAFDTHCFWYTKKLHAPEERSRASSDDLPSAGDVSADDFHSLLRQWKNYKTCLFDTVSQHGEKRGNQGGAGTEYPSLQKRKTIDYRQFLYQFTRPGEEPVLDMESFDYIAYYYGMHLPPAACGGSPLLLEPLEYQEVNRLDELAIAIDTSGSCSGRIVRRFLEETWAILRQKDNFFSGMRLHLIQCDSMIQEHRILTGVDEWEEAIRGYRVMGQGDTDFRPVFTLLHDLLQKKEIRSLRGLLYFSDGDGIFPDEHPEFETAFIFLQEPKQSLRIPDWVTRLNLNLPDDF